MHKAVKFHFFLILGLLIACSGQQTRSESIKSVEGSSNKQIQKQQNIKTALGKQMTLLEEVENRYAQASTFRAKIKKTLKLKMLDQERVQTGSLNLKKPGMFRLELTGDEKSLAITDGKTIWIVAYPTDPEFDNTTRIVRSREPQKIKSQALLAFVFGQGRLLKSYKIKTQKTADDISTFELESKNKEEETKNINVKVSISRKEILSLQYEDKIENQTTVEFLESQFNPKTESKIFKFSPPKEAEITDI